MLQYDPHENRRCACWLLCILCVVLELAGASLLVAASHHRRAQSVSKYDAAVARWTAIRPEFALAAFTLRFNGSSPHHPCTPCRRVHSSEPASRAHSPGEGRYASPGEGRPASRASRASPLRRLASSPAKLAPPALQRVARRAPRAARTPTPRPP